MPPNLKLLQRETHFTEKPIGVGTFRTSEKAIKYVNEVLRSERLSYGPFTQKFERLFAAQHGCRFAIMTNSGTSSLLIALHALKIRYNWADGDEVIVPAVTFVATVNVVLQLNLKPVLVDVEPTHYELDPDKLEQALTSRTRCIIPVHLFGNPCEMNKIVAFAQKHSLRIVEDSCETMFTQYEGKSVGSFGDIGCFSTYVAHLLCTGVGGLSTTNDPELAILLRSLANHGRDSIYISIDDDKDKTAEELSLIAQRRFSFIHPGYSFRVTEMEGAVGLAELEDSEDMMTKRRNNGQELLKKLRGLESHMQLPTVRPNAGHAFMMFPIVLKNEKKRNLVDQLERAGIETRDMLPLTNQPVYKNLLNLREENYPVAKWINESGFYVGCHQGMSETEIDYIVDTLYGYFQHHPETKEKSCLVVMSKIDRNVDEFTLHRTVASFRQDGFDEYILADASTNPKISEAFAKAGFTVVSGQHGKGDLLKNAVQNSQSDLIVVMGVDGADDPKDAARILIKLRQGMDLVVGSRFLPGGERKGSRSVSFNSIGNRFFTFMLGLLFGENVTDCNNLLRGFSKKTFEKINLKSSGETVMFEMTAQALSHQLSYGECPTVERKSLLPHTKTNRLVMAFRFLLMLSRYLIERNK